MSLRAKERQHYLEIVFATAGEGLDEQRRGAGAQRMAAVTANVEAPQQVWPSVDDVAPMEEGGPIARSGFSYQDEVGVSFLIEMLEDPSLLKVHFETHDDFVLVRQDATAPPLVAEYVQVKAEEPDQLWSVPRLCEKKKAIGRSLFETSLGRDRHAETGRFRIVTLRQPVKQLNPLTYPLASEARTLASEGMVALHKELDNRFPEVKSPKGNDCGYWLAHCRWDVRNDLKTLTNENRRRLLFIGNKAGCTLLFDQIENLLEDLRVMAKTAGDAKWVPDKSRKIIAQASVWAWWTKRLQELVDGAARPTGGKLVDKLGAATVPEEIIALAVDMRRDYAATIRTSRYMESEGLSQLQGRVKSDVLTLRTRFVSGALQLTGAQFHALCVERMDVINAARPQGMEDQSAYLKGCLYDIADRCLLRFAAPAS